MLPKKRSDNQEMKKIARYYITLSELLLLKILFDANSKGLTKDEIIKNLNKKIKSIKKQNPFFRIQWPAGQDLSGELFKFKELRFIDNDYVNDKIIWKAIENEKGGYNLNVWLQESKRLNIPGFKLLYES